MPRIRTLKPEHKQHRKVGMLTDRQYRLWVGMITEADDEGRLCADATQLRALVFAYQPEVTAQVVADDLMVIEQTGMLHLYRVGETLYAHFVSWGDHQRIDHPTPSKLPVPTCCGRGAACATARAARNNRAKQKTQRATTRRDKVTHGESDRDSPGLPSANTRECSRGLANPPVGSEGIGSERKGKDLIGGEHEGEGLLTQSGTNGSGNDDNDTVLRTFARLKGITLDEARRHQQEARRVGRS